MLGAGTTSCNLQSCVDQYVAWYSSLEHLYLSLSFLFFIYTRTCTIEAWPLKTSNWPETYLFGFSSTFIDYTFTTISICSRCKANALFDNKGMHEMISFRNSGIFSLFGWAAQETDFLPFSLYLRCHCKIQHFNRVEHWVNTLNGAWIFPILLMVSLCKASGSRNQNFFAGIFLPQYYTHLITVLSAVKNL